MAKTTPVTLKKIAKKNSDLNELLESCLTSTNGEQERKGYVRSSSIYNICPMEEILCYNNDVEREETLSAKTVLTFAIGKSIHSFIQESLKKHLLGGWKCLCCEFISNGKEPIPIPCTCSHCGMNEFEYVEPSLFDKDLMMSGHVDGIIDDYVIEIKTMREDAYNSFKWGQLPDGYIWQCNAYMMMTGKKSVQVIAVNKNTSEYSTMLVQPDKNIIEQIAGKCMCVKEGIETDMRSLEKLPRVCATRDDPRAKKCIVRDKCFSFKE